MLYILNIIVDIDNFAHTCYRAKLVPTFNCQKFSIIMFFFFFFFFLCVSVIGLYMTCYLLYDILVSKQRLFYTLPWFFFSPIHKPDSVIFKS